MVDKMNLVYKEIMSKPAKLTDFRSIVGTTPEQWFKSCLDPNGSSLSKEVMHNESKQSIKQFQKYFPELGDTNEQR
jgi:hypothetical protein